MAHLSSEGFAEGARLPKGCEGQLFLEGVVLVVSIVRLLVKLFMRVACKVVGEGLWGLLHRAGLWALREPGAAEVRCAARAYLKEHMTLHR